jgi:hypothetical protein
MTKLLLSGIAALPLLYAAGAHATEQDKLLFKWQCGNVGVTVSDKSTPDDGWFGPREYTVIGVEKVNNRFLWSNDGFYLNGKLCWPVFPVTCLRPDGTAEPCESRQVPLPKPRPADAPEAVPIPKTVLYYEPGGYLHILEERWRKLAESGDDVEIRGPWFSGCTMIMAHVPKERICFDRVASLNFHLPQVDDREVALQGGRYMLNRYPQDIRLWLREKGGVENMPHKEGWWILWAHELWDMGYRKCEPEELPVPMTITKSAKMGMGG